MSRGARRHADDANLRLVGTLAAVGASISCKTLRAGLIMAKAAGVDPGPLLAQFRIQPVDLEDPDARFTHDVWIALWQRVDAVGPGAFGLRAAKSLPIGHFDALDYVFASSDDLHSGLGRFCRYFAVLSTGVTHQLADDPKDASVVRLERRYAPDAHTSLPHPVDFAFACLVLRSRRMLGVEWRPRRVEFAHGKPADDAEHREVFACPFVWDAPVSALVIDRATLALPMQRPAPELVRVLEQHANAILARMPKAIGASDPEPDLRTRTREAIVAGLRGGQTSLAEIAKQLGMSDRTLQRRLGELDTSHAKLLDEVRSELAVRYLGEPALSIGEIGFLLGFGDVSAFHRAFRRWTRSSPAEHRRTLASRV